MQVNKVINNSVVIALNAHSQEAVLIGKGIGFNKKTGDRIDLSKVSKTFVLKSKGVAERLSKIVQNIPIEHLKVCDEIINMAKRELNTKIDDRIYLTLIDHISYAIERHKKGIDMQNVLSSETKVFYPNEYAIGLKAVEIINNRLNLNIPNDEAAYIAFHIINSNQNTNNEDIFYPSIQLMKQVLEIIETEYQRTFDEDSLAYTRFITHLKFFTHRLLQFDYNQSDASTEDEVFAKSIFTQFPEDYLCTEKIASLIYREYQKEIPNHEKAYLTIHLHRLSSSTIE